MTDTKEPCTADFIKELLNTFCHKCCDFGCDCKPLYEYIIHRAQEQAFNEGITTTTEKMQVATDVLVREARVQAIEDVLEIVKYKTVFDYSEQEEKARIYGCATIEVESIDINEIRALLDKP